MRATHLPTMLTLSWSAVAFNRNLQVQVHTLQELAYSSDQTDESELAQIHSSQYTIFEQSSQYQ